MFYTLEDVEAKPLLKEHQNFYLKGIMNALTPEFLGGGKKVLTEKDVNGETLEVLRMMGQTLFPDLKDGQVSRVVTYRDYNKLFGLDDESLSASELAEAEQNIARQLKLALGSFTFSKVNGQYVVHDIYDFARSGEVDTFSETIVKQSQTWSPYFYARYFGEKLMAEGDSNNMKVRIVIPNEPEIVPNAFEPEFDVASKTFNLEGPMTPRRKSLWDTISATLFQSAEAEEAPEEAPTEVQSGVPLPAQKPQEDKLSMSVPVPPQRRTLEEVVEERTAMNETEFMNSQMA